MKKIIHFISLIELSYLLILPFMGYLGTGILNGSFFLMPLLGISVLFVYQILGYAFWSKKVRSANNKSHLFLPLSIALILFNYVWLQENFWLFWVEKALLEVGAISLSFSIALYFESRNRKGKITDDDGKGYALILGALFIASIYEMAKAWFINFPYDGPSSILHVSAMLISFVLDIFWIYPLLLDFSRGDSVAEDLTEGKYGMVIIIVELVLWVIAIPAIFLITGIIH
jgi:hypothetical protein